MWPMAIYSGDDVAHGNLFGSLLTPTLVLTLTSAASLALRAAASVRVRVSKHTRLTPSLHKQRGERGTARSRIELVTPRPESTWLQPLSHVGSTLKVRVRVRVSEC